MQILPDEEYNHFLKLFVAVRLCSSNVYKPYRSIAAKLFKLYVEEYAKIYGEQSIGSNVHNLIHICEDMESSNVGNLMDISTYKYENSLRLLGLQFKHSNRPLEQVVCRSIEKSQMKFDPIIQSVSFVPNFFRPFKQQNRLLYKKVEVKPGLILSNGKNNCNDSWFLTKSKDIIKFEWTDMNSIYGFKIKHKESFFENPIDSMRIDIYKCLDELETVIEAFDFDHIQAKMMRLSYENQLVFIPLLHSLDPVE